MDGGSCVEVKLETNKLFLETKIDISKVSLTTGPGMKEIKRIGADFYQFNSQKREPNIWKIFHIYSLSAFQLLFALFVQSLFQFAWSSGQLTESSDKLMQQWEYDLWTKWKDKFREPSAGLVFINKYLHKIWLRWKYLQHFVWPESRTYPVFGWGMAKAACRECQNVWPNERRDETGNDGQIGSLYCINACRRYLFMNYEYLMGKRVKNNISVTLDELF